MEERGAWKRDELSGGIVLFRNIETAQGTLLSIYLGPGGVFAHMSSCDLPQAIFHLLKDTLRTTRLQFYTEEQGLYDAASDSFSDPVPPEDTQALALTFVDGSDVWLGYTAADLKRMGDRLIFMDAYARGWYRSREGKEYLFRGNTFQEVSDIDPNVLYHLTLFGGVLGIHRFYMGKNLTGFLYLLTGGLLLSGWAVDLLFLLTGIQRDKRKRLLYAPSHRLRKVLLLPIGFLFSCLILAGVRMLLRLLLHS